MKKFICGILGLVIFYFICLKIGEKPEDRLAKYMKKKYNKEFEVIITGHASWRFGDAYAALMFPKENIGTPKETDRYYAAIGNIDGRKIEDNYLTVILKQQANEFYSHKLKELFEDNFFCVFKMEKNSVENDFQKELIRRKRIIEENPSMIADYYLLEANIYIFGNLKDDKEKEEYREKIYKFVKYMKETNAFYYTALSVKVIDEKFFTKGVFKEIVRKEEEEEIKSLERLEKKLEEISETWSIVNPNVIVATQEIKKIVSEEKKKAENKENKEKTENIDNTSEKNIKDIVMQNLSISTIEELLDKYGKVLLSSDIMSPKKAKDYIGERTYINPYERKEDILFEGEEIKYPNGTIKELSKWKSYYITEIKNNKRNGVSIKYDKNGEVIWKGNFKDNLLDGPFKNYGERWIKEGMYKNDLIEGEVLSIDKKDGSTIKEFYRNGLLEGEKIYYNPDGSIDEIYEYKKGKLNGTSKKFREEGKIYEVLEWKDDEKNGKYIKYDSEGRIEEMEEYKNGMIDGVAKKFSKGKIISENHYKENRPYGIQKQYYSNETIKKEVFYDEENWKRWEKLYSENGKLENMNIYGKYSSNVELKRVYNENEKLIKEVEYTYDGIEIVKEYSEKDGTLVSTRYFKDGIEQKNY